MINHLEFPVWVDGVEFVVNVWEDEIHTLGLRLYERKGSGYNPSSSPGPRK